MRSVSEENFTQANCAWAVLTFQAHERRPPDRRTLRRRDARGQRYRYRVRHSWRAQHRAVPRPVCRPRLRHVLARHEQNAAFAADGFARAGGRAPRCSSSPAPASATHSPRWHRPHSDSVPMLVIASTPVRASLGRHWGVLHELADQRALAAGATGFAWHAIERRRSARAPAEAFAYLRRPRQRPAYLGFRSTFSRSRPRCAPSASSPRRAAPARAGGRSPRRARSSPRRAAPAHHRRRRRAARRRGVGAAPRHARRLPRDYRRGQGRARRGSPGNLGASLPYRATQELIAAADVVLAAGTELSGDRRLHHDPPLRFRGA